MSVLTLHYKRLTYQHWQTDWKNSEVDRDTYTVFNKVGVNNCCAKQVVQYFISGQEAFQYSYLKLASERKTDVVMGRLAM